jgi:hypothetical protein
LSETFADHADHADDDESSDGDSDSAEVQQNGADCAPASRLASRCESRDSLTRNRSYESQFQPKNFSDKF